MKCFICEKKTSMKEGGKAVITYGDGYRLSVSACKEHKPALDRVFEMWETEIWLAQRRVWKDGVKS